MMNLAQYHYLRIFCYNFATSLQIINLFLVQLDLKQPTALSFNY